MAQSYTLRIIFSTMHAALRRALAEPFASEDEIWACGSAALGLLPTRPRDSLRLAHAKLHAFPYKDVPTCWRRLYTEASLWICLHLAEDEAERIDEQAHAHCSPRFVDNVVHVLDMALILAGAPRREDLIHELMSQLTQLAYPEDAARQPVTQDDGDQQRKKTKTASAGTDDAEDTFTFPLRFPTTNSVPTPPIRFPIPRHENLSLERFQQHLLTTTDDGTQTPIVIAGALEHWPALHERSWNNPHYLLAQTVGGRRLVPVEVGRSYTDADWGQRIMPFRDFLRTYMLADADADPAGPDEPRPSEPDRTRSNETTTKTKPKKKQKKQTGYLAQHDLFAQIPSLRADLCIPDYCYCTPPPPPTKTPPAPPLPEPLLNIWLGPAATVSPLHTDPHHNILTQLLGAKYLRLYPPAAGPRHLYPRPSRGPDGVDMANTSAVDVGVAMRVFEGYHGSDGEGVVDVDVETARQEMERRFPRFREARYVECVLRAGECLYIPPGWWHYVLSLEPSCSVSFWWD